jgi:[ribosomal protein S5]-alanine N-acetyltransferase
VAPETFELARLRLRRPKLSDADALFAIGCDPEVARYADWPLSTERGPGLERLRQRAELWESGAEYYWVITLAHDDRAIGAVSTRVARHAADVGYLLDRRHWGNGYATEAARAIVDWALSTPSIERVWATCDTENVASARVLEKAGMKREGTLRRAIVRPNLSNEPRDAFIYARVR